MIMSTDVNNLLEKTKEKYFYVVLQYFATLLEFA